MTNYEEHIANERERSEDTERSSLEHQVRTRDIFLAQMGGNNSKYKETKGKGAKAKEYGKDFEGISNLGVALLASDAAYQVTREMLRGEHKVSRAKENWERRVAAMGDCKDPLKILNEETRKAKSLLRKQGYNVRKK